MKLAVVLNCSAGTLAAVGSEGGVDRVRKAMSGAGLDGDVRSVDRGDIDRAVRDAVRSNADVVVIGGGDGTLNAAAAVLIESGKPLGVLPLGTRNHFARDLGVPVDVEGAIAMIRDGRERRIDVGEVNGRIFLNNSSIGLYPAAVDERDELRHRHGSSKASAMLRSCANVLRRFPLFEAVLETEGRAVSMRTPFVFVSNNRYEMNLFALGARSRLDAGELGIYLTRNTNRLGLLRLAFLAMIGRMKQDRDFRYLTGGEVEVRTRRHSVRVSLDGEVIRMTSPIRYAIRPRALAVVGPAVEASIA